MRYSHRENSCSTWRAEGACPFPTFPESVHRMPSCEKKKLFHTHPASWNFFDLPLLFLKHGSPLHRESWFRNTYITIQRPSCINLLNLSPALDGYARENIFNIKRLTPMFQSPHSWTAKIPVMLRAYRRKRTILSDFIARNFYRIAFQNWTSSKLRTGLQERMFLQLRVLLLLWLRSLSTLIYNFFIHL